MRRRDGVLHAGRPSAHRTLSSRVRANSKPVPSAVVRVSDAATSIDGLIASRTSVTQAISLPINQSARLWWRSCGRSCTGRERSQRRSCVHRPLRPVRVCLPDRPIDWLVRKRRSARPCSRKEAARSRFSRRCCRCRCRCRCDRSGTRTSATRPVLRRPPHRTWSDRRAGRRSCAAARPLRDDVRHAPADRVVL